MLKIVSVLKLYLWVHVGLLVFFAGLKYDPVNLKYLPFGY
jgi:hypothetical protein